MIVQFDSKAIESLELKTRRIGCMPIVQSFITRLEVKNHFRRHLKNTSKSSLDYTEVLLVMVSNILSSGDPVYGIGEWAEKYEPSALGLTSSQIAEINDDRIGRALDALFLANRNGLMTDLVIDTIRKFNIDLSTFHNDSTTVKFTGDYSSTNSYLGKKAVEPKRGHSKDHRPDLKQLLFNLTVSRDHAIPVYHQLYDGNVTDDKTHIASWEYLRRLCGNSDFCYVADSKLCTREQMEYIDRSNGKFITILPKTRSEDRLFKTNVLHRKIDIQWKEVRKTHCKSGERESNIFWAYESPTPSSEGFRIIWIKSSQKRDLDEQSRDSKLSKTMDDLDDLRANKVGSYYNKTESQIQKSIDRILAQYKTRKYIRYRIFSEETITHAKVGRGRPGPNSKYKQVKTTNYTFDFEPDIEEIGRTATEDGIFPIITNYRPDEKSAREILNIYKFQPRLEKRFSALKSCLEVAPVYLKAKRRVESYLFLHFISLLIYGLIERETRISMKKSNKQFLRIYPEKRDCYAPSAFRLMELFNDLKKSYIISNGSVLKVFEPELSQIQSEVMDLLGVRLSEV